MTEKEVAVKLAEHGKEIGSLKHRMGDVEKEMNMIQELTLSIRELAINMKNMLEEQRKQGRRIEVLEAKPAEHWNAVTKAIVTTVVGALVGAAITMILK